MHHLAGPVRVVGPVHEHGRQPVYDLQATVDQKLDLPVVFFEFGSDAFNAREEREDQVSQALILRDQWQEMYNKAYGNGEEGNAIGAFVFEWRDEWWKYLQTENLDTQDTHASWANQAYLFDWAPGKNNMNEEWFGVMALGPTNEDGVSIARPRAAYHVLRETFAIDPYGSSKEQINDAFKSIDPEAPGSRGGIGSASENQETSSKH